jgi:hypothetical protein
MTRTEEIIVVAIVIACTIGRLLYQARMANLRRRR